MLDPFLTAFDPSDLPGGSVDPLGFDRGYTLLADKLLPGLTNVANRPRYFSVLCAAIALSDERADRGGESPRECLSRRVEAVLRAERFWTLACALAARKEEALGVDGIRGIRYVHRALARFDARGDTSTDADFPLLSRQMPYGLVGIYGSVGDELGLIDRGSMTLGPDVGRRLGEAFLAETAVPDSLRRAIASGGTVGMTTLSNWGATAHVNAERGDGEHRALRDAVTANDVRRRMAILLARHPPTDGEHELTRLQRVLRSLADSDDDADLREGMRAVVAFEECYRLLLLGFQRLLWRCQKDEPFAVLLDDLHRDEVLGAIVERLPGAWDALERAINEAGTHAFAAGLERLADVQRFVRDAASRRDPASLVEHVVAHHRDVQHAKIAGGRRKMPWLEIRDGKVTPTLASALRVVQPPEHTDDVLAHPYRTFAADQFQAEEKAS